MQGARVQQVQEQLEGRMQEMQEDQAAIADLMAGKDTERARALTEKNKLRQSQAEAMEKQLQQDPRYAEEMKRADEEAREEERRNPSGVESEFNLTDQQEAEVGFGMVQYFLGSQRLIEDPELQAYVNAVGMWVALQSERPALPWRFAVLDTDNPNAFAVPGGYVFITTGMLKMIRTESELAGVLGHEVSHVVRKHHLRWIYMNKDLKTQMERSEVAMRKLNPSLSKQLREMGRLAQSQMEAMTTGSMKANLSKAEEMQADRDAVVLAWRAGYEAWGLVAVLQRFEALTRSRRTGGKNTLDAHPEPLERFKSLDLALRARPEAQTLGEQAGVRFEQATLKLRGTNL